MNCAIGDLTDTLKAAGLPIDGVSGTTNTRVDWLPGVTPTQAQLDQAQSIIAGWDWSDAAQQARDDARQPERTGLRQAATQAVANNQTFLGIANPSNAQTLAQVKALTQQMNAVIRRLVQLD